jgi:hypothetical protein
MDMLPMAMILGTNVSREQINSALPNAPVVLEVERRPRAGRSRAALARVLERAARVVEPKPLTTCSPAH